MRLRHRRRPPPEYTFNPAEPEVVTVRVGATMHVVQRVTALQEDGGEPLVVDTDRRFTILAIDAEEQTVTMAVSDHCEAEPA